MKIMEMREYISREIVLNTGNNNHEREILEENVRNKTKNQNKPNEIYDN